jgi:hypothetical protein
MKSKEKTKVPDSIKYYVDVQLRCRPVTKRCTKGKKIAGNIQYVLMEAIDGMEEALKKHRVRVAFSVLPR